MNTGVGIFLGESYSSVAFEDTEVKILRSKENEELVSSCVSLINEEIVVGKTAYNTGLKRNPENTILSVKRLMGRAWKDKMVQDMISNKYYKYGITKLRGGTVDAVAVLLGGKQYTPEQISAEILKKLQRDAEEKLGDEVTHAVITVPAYFTEKQKNATRIAAQLAGLKVQKLLAEPTAAAIAYGIDNLKVGESKTVLIYDFGGGTFDLSVLNIVDGQYIEAGTGGDRWLGGDDIDKKLHELIFKKIESEYKIANIGELIEAMPKKKRYLLEAEIRIQTEAAKIRLSSSKNAEIFIPNQLEDKNGQIIDIEFNITRQEFEKAIKPFIQKTIDLLDELLKEIGYDIGMIDYCCYIGDEPCFPVLRKTLYNYFGEKKVLISDKPHLVIAKGAAILSHRLGLENENTTTTSKSNDTSSYTSNHNYFLEYQTKEGGIDYKKIIEKQMPLPCSVTITSKIDFYNMLFKVIEIYSDVEGNYKEKISISLYLKNYIPINTKVFIEITLDENENIDANMNIKGGSKKYKSILGRGQKDSACINTIWKVTDKIQNGNFAKHIKSNSINNIRRLLNQFPIEEMEPMDVRWSEIDFKIKNIYDEIFKN